MIIGFYNNRSKVDKTLKPSVMKIAFKIVDGYLPQEKKSVRVPSAKRAWQKISQILISFVMEPSPFEISYK